MGRISRPRPKTKPEFVNEVRVGCGEVDQPWLTELLAQIAGSDGFKKRTSFWAYTVFSFVHREQADRLEREIQDRRWRDRLQAKARPCPVAEAVRAQHAVVWGCLRASSARSRGPIAGSAPTAARMATRTWLPPASSSPRRRRSISTAPARWSIRCSPG